ncbi:MAG: hypothetical protein IJX72_07590 [Clostridia bacterium]|nr:hypothetical protein [Clostridia bacterium]
MILQDDAIQEVNKVYYVLEMKQAEIVHALFHRMFEIESGWFNGHFHKAEDGGWQRESFPIPVITVKGLCDVEIGFKEITVTTKLRRKQTLDYSFDKLTDYSFEAYGVEDYLNDFYVQGKSIQEMKESIEKSHETDIGFSFTFPFDTEGKDIFEFVKFIRREGFYY